MTYPRPHSYLVENLGSEAILSASDQDNWEFHYFEHPAISCYRYLYERVMGRELTEVISILLLPLAPTPLVFRKDLCTPAIIVPVGTEKLEKIRLISVFFWTVNSKFNQNCSPFHQKKRNIRNVHK